MTRVPHPTPPAGSLSSPTSYRHVEERTPPTGLPQSHLRGLGTDPAAPPRSALYAQAIDAAPDDVARWQVNKEWTGRALDENDDAVKRTGKLADAVAKLSSAVAGLHPLPSAVNALQSAVDEMRLAVGLELGVNGTTLQKNSAADAKAAERIVQLEGALSDARAQLARHDALLTPKNAAVGGGVGTVLTLIAWLVMYVTGHWK